MDYKVLDPDEIIARLPDGVAITPHVEVYASTSSTNDVVWGLGQVGVAEGRVVFAETQTKGRGTRGRTWQSTLGRGLWFSVLLRPQFPKSEWTRVTPALAVAVAQTVEQFSGGAAGIKWPNDVHLNGRKICGILAEASLTGPQQFLVAGVGLNVLQSREDFGPGLEDIATSLLAEGAHADREAVAGALIGRILEAYASCATNEGFAHIIAEFRHRNVLLGRDVAIQDGERSRRGTVCGISERGHLQLTGPEGDWEAASGTVQL